MNDWNSARVSAGPPKMFICHRKPMSEAPFAEARNGPALVSMNA
jgi:hypothetical protein